MPGRSGHWDPCLIATASLPQTLASVLPGWSCLMPGEISLEIPGAPVAGSEIFVPAGAQLLLTDRSRLAPRSTGPSWRQRPGQKPGDRNFCAGRLHSRVSAGSPWLGARQPRPGHFHCVSLPLLLSPLLRSSQTVLLGPICLCEGGHFLKDFHDCFPLYLFQIHLFN